ncbi:MAG: hypothetical protein RLZZ22_1347 [Pseudomonadota bacterium]|jgi:hypothetical protein
MSDTTTKATENVVNRRRASDWYAGDGVAFIDAQGMARVTAALSGARTIAAILMQRELDRNNDDGQEAGLQLDEVTACGLFNALASCIEVAEHHATEEAAWTTRLCDHDTKETEHLRNAAFSAHLHRKDRRAVERVELMNKCKAAKAAKKEAA